MSVIKLPLLYVGSESEMNLQTQFNSGFKFSFIDLAIADKIADIDILNEAVFVPTLTKGHFIKIIKSVRLDFYLHDVLLNDEFLVVPGLSEEAIIGAATMQKWRIKLNFEYDTVEVDPKVAKMQLI